MFESFFPKPKLFLFTLIIWVAFVIAVYYLIGRNLAELLGFNFSPDDAETVIGMKVAFLNSGLMEALMIHEVFDYNKAFGKAADATKSVTKPAE